LSKCTCFRLYVSARLEIPLHTVIKIEWDGWHNLKEERFSFQRDGDEALAEDGAGFRDCDLDDGQTDI